MTVARTLTRMTLPDIPERAIQRQVAQAVHIAGRPGVCWTHIPSGGLRNKAVAAKLKADGHQAGWPDLQFYFAGQAYFLELKTRHGQVQPKQKALHAALRAQGALVEVVRSFDEAMAVLARWGLLRVAGTNINLQPEMIP